MVDATVFMLFNYIRLKKEESKVADILFMSRYLKFERWYSNVLPETRKLGREELAILRACRKWTENKAVGKVNVALSFEK